MKGAVCLLYYRGEKRQLTPFLETTSILFQHEKSYNKDTKHLKMGKLTFNIEPLLLQEGRTFIESLSAKQNQTYSLIN